MGRTTTTTTTDTDTTTLTLPDGPVGTGGRSGNGDGRVSDADARTAFDLLAAGKTVPLTERAAASGNPGGYLNALRAAFVRIGVPADTVGRVIARDGGIGLSA